VALTANSARGGAGSAEEEKLWCEAGWSRAKNSQLPLTRDFKTLRRGSLTLKFLFHFLGEISQSEQSVSDLQVCFTCQEEARRPHAAPASVRKHRKRRLPSKFHFL